MLSGFQSWRSRLLKRILIAEAGIALLLTCPQSPAANATPEPLPYASCAAGTLLNHTLMPKSVTKPSPAVTPTATAPAPALPPVEVPPTQPTIAPAPPPSTPLFDAAGNTPNTIATPAATLPPTLVPPVPPSLAPLPPTAAPASLVTCSSNLIALINRVRSSHGLSPLVENPLLTAAAQRYAEFIATHGVLSHSADGRTFDQRIEETGYAGWTGLGENLAGGYRTPEEAVQGWLASEAHLANILDPSFTETGFGCAQNPASEYSFFWVEEFGSR